MAGIVRSQSSYDASYIAMGWAWFGSPRMKNAANPNLRSYAAFNKVFGDKLAKEAYKNETRVLAERYATQVKDAFTRTHGRTGKTSESMYLKHGVRPGTAETISTFTWSVLFSGNIGFVVNPLRAHTIRSRGQKYLSNYNTWGPRAVTPSRTKNFYAEFSMYPGFRFEQVQWYQGGEQSFSPDREFYKSEQPWLEAQAAMEMGKLAQYAKTLWAEENSGFVVINEGPRGQSLQFLRMPPPGE